MRVGRGERLLRDNDVSVGRALRGSLAVLEQLVPDLPQTLIRHLQHALLSGAPVVASAVATHIQHLTAIIGSVLHCESSMPASATRGCAALQHLNFALGVRGLLKETLHVVLDGRLQQLDRQYVRVRGR